MYHEIIAVPILINTPGLKFISFFVFLLHLEFSTAFKSKYLDTAIQLSKFQMLKPWFIKRLRTWNTCCCRYHTKLGMLLRALNEIRKDVQGIHVGCLRICEVCKQLGHHGRMACASQFSGLTTFWSFVLCSIRPLHLWHKECVLGECTDCGAET